MSPAARTLRFFGFYLVVVGLIVVAVPNLLLGALGVPSTDEPWIRILGVVVVVLGSYYVVAARNDFTAFFRATVAARAAAGAGLIVIVSLWGYWSAAAFGLVEIVAALWTRAALRRESGAALNSAPDQRNSAPDQREPSAP